jgi:MerR family copper efflux transcriptional regulator
MEQLDLHGRIVDLPVRWKVKRYTPWMQIGELADRAGVSAKTIRYYEEVGVLDAPNRTSNGYRDYSAETIDRLGFIRASQAIGLTLGEIREILALRNRGETPCKHVADLIAARAADIGAKIEELEQMRSELERLSRRARRLSPSDCRPSDICHVVER